MGHRIKIPGQAGKIEARALRVHAAVMAELERLAASKRPKPKKPPKRSFAHIRTIGRQPDDTLERRTASNSRA
jgi:hypothetical protein